MLKKWTPTFLMLTSLLLLFVPNDWVVQFRRTTLTLVDPMDRFVAGSLRTAAGVPRKLFEVPDFASRIAQLQNEAAARASERDSAEARVAELERTIQSLTEARAMVGNDAQLVPTPVQIVEKPARVLAVHQGLRGTLIIAAGRIGGVQEGDPVVYAKYVVGRVITAGLDSSQVQLVTDPGFTAAAFTNPGPIEGTVHGEAGSHCIMKHVLQSDDLKVGAIVLTSGFSVSFPRGFGIGSGSKVSSTYDARFQRVEIEPAVMPDQLESVLVLVKRAQDGP